MENLIKTIKQLKKIKANGIPLLMLEEIKLLKEQNDILRKNTAITAGGVLVSLVALVIALIALLK